jgi:hypothetical protein
MAPTPITASDRINIAYTVNGLTHHLRFYTDVSVDSTDPTGYTVPGYPAGASAGASQAVADLIVKLKALFAADCSFDTFSIEQYVSGAWVVLATGSIGVTGTISGSSHPASEVTMTFYSATHKFIRVVLLETPDAPPIRQGYGTLGANYKAFVDDMLVRTGGKHLGTWVKSRGDSFVQTFLAEVVALNRRVRRRRGLG